jgi:hypothetical protein
MTLDQRLQFRNIARGCYHVIAAGERMLGEGISESRRCASNKPGGRAHETTPSAETIRDLGVSFPHRWLIDNMAQSE